MSEEQIPTVVVPFDSAAVKPRRPFVPMTGNPEAHDYADFVRSLGEGSVVSLEQHKTPPK